MKFFLIVFLVALSASAQVKVSKKPLAEKAKLDPVTRDLQALEKSKPATPTVWLSPEQAKALSRVTSRSYITKIERKGGDVIYTWTNGLHGAVTTQRVDQIINKPARDARRDEFEKVRKERDNLKAENTKLKKGK